MHEGIWKGALVVDLAVEKCVGSDRHSTHALPPIKLTEYIPVRIKTDFAIGRMVLVESQQKLLGIRMPDQ